jgi:DNA ligase-1
MAKGFAPMLAATIDPKKDADVFSKLKFPLLGSPKLDGIRAVGRDERLKSRKLLDLPSAQAQALFGHLIHFDGEIIAGSSTAPDVYNVTQSYVMSKDKQHPELTYYVFDWADPEAAYHPFNHRMLLLAKAVADLNRVDVKLVPQVMIHNLEELIAFEEEMLALGYEGIMLRDPTGMYKHGRSTFREQTLMKLKRFEDFEAQVVGLVEQMTNTNVAEKDELGHSKRSSAKAGMVGAGTLGKFLVHYDTDEGQDLLEIPCGVLTHKQRKAIWEDDGLAIGQYIKVRHFPIGAKNKPRLPRCVGFRDRMDF